MQKTDWPLLSVLFVGVPDYLLWYHTLPHINCGVCTQYLTSAQLMTGVLTLFFTLTFMFLKSNIRFDCHSRFSISHLYHFWGDRHLMVLSVNVSSDLNYQYAVLFPLVTRLLSPALLTGFWPCPNRFNPLWIPDPSPNLISSFKL